MESKDINDSIEEGKLLICAISRLMYYYPKLSPDEILERLEEVKRKVYNE